ncbi:MAG: hypothetical protein FJ088_05095 [Deltaproteobacteria bacterium]|nr:hypothetical protein [Deltaproteobacteria bacterium]
MSPLRRFSVLVLLLFAATVTLSRCASSGGKGDDADAHEGDAIEFPDVEVFTPKPVASADEALKLVKDLVLARDEPHGFVLYGLPEPIDAAIPVSDRDGAEDWLIDGNAYLFLADDNPFAKFGHAVRYIYVAADTGMISVTSHGFYPLQNGEPLFGDTDTDASGFEVLEHAETALGPVMEAGNFSSYKSAQISENTPQKPFSWKSPPCPEGEKPRYRALLIKGIEDSDETGEMTGKDMQKMKSALDGVKAPDGENPLWETTEAGNLDDVKSFFTGGNCCDHILIYAGAHGSKRRIYTDDEGNERECYFDYDHDVVYCDDCESVPPEQAAQYLNNPKKDDPNDESGDIAIIPDPRETGMWLKCKKGGIYDHKITDEDKAPLRYLLWVEKETISADAFADLINSLASCNVTFIGDFCFSGGFTDVLDKRGSVFQSHTTAGYSYTASCMTKDGNSTTNQALVDCFNKFKDEYMKNDPYGGQNVQEEFLMFVTDCLGKDDPWVKAAATGKVTCFDPKTGKVVEEASGGWANQHTDKVRKQPCICCNGYITEPPLPEGYCDNTPESCKEGEKCVECSCVNLCGNGELDEGEKCDGWLGCPEGSVCQSGCKSCSECGNGKVEEGEECELGDECGADLPCEAGCVCPCQSGAYACCQGACTLGNEHTLACQGFCDKVCSPYFLNDDYEPGCARKCALGANGKEWTCSSLGEYADKCAQGCKK